MELMEPKGGCSFPCNRELVCSFAKRRIIEYCYHQTQQNLEKATVDAIDYKINPNYLKFRSDENITAFT